MTLFLSSYKKTSICDYFLARIRFSKDGIQDDLNCGLNIAVINREKHAVTFHPWNKEYPITDSEWVKWSTLHECDAISIEKSGINYCFYESQANEAVIVTGLACNTNCIMCPVSEQARNHTLTATKENIISQVKYYGSEINHVTITGGEPTLMMLDLPEVIKAVQYQCPNAAILILTNGRTFSVNAYANLFNDLMHKEDRIAIPIHGSTAELHDAITQVRGAFSQTKHGLENLSQGAMRIEIRIVVSKLNHQDVSAIVDFILGLPRVSVVNFIALEMCGSAIVNKSCVWIEYPDAAQACEDGIEKLIHAGIDTGLYNFPRCVVNHKYWAICKDSISDYKIRFAPECNNCKVRSICGGVFNSTLSTGCFKARPILE